MGVDELARSSELTAGTDIPIPMRYIAVVHREGSISEEGDRRSFAACALQNFPSRTFDLPEFGSQQASE